MNLWQLERETAARHQGDASLGAAYLDAGLLRQWLAEAYRILQRAAWLSRSVATIATTAGTVRVSAPADLLDHLIVDPGVMWRTPAGPAMALKNRPPGWLRDQFGRPEDFTATGTMPRYWSYSDQPGMLEIWPPPPSAHAAGLIVHYIPDPGTLDRTQTASTITVSATYGSDTLEFATPLAGGMIVPGDEIGIIESGATIPRVWATLDSWNSSNSAKLTAPWSGLTAAGAGWISAQVSPLERTRPGLIASAPVEYALAKLAGMDDGPKAEEARMVYWQAELARVRIDADSGPLPDLARPVQFSGRPALARRLRG
jgi:hypothetical protein